ncbi:hypothetical protein PCASD_17715 [Puccinia coronata f. sp. avenae]|uniref:Uncharacterized protein n=1 Tax=Puccinia coronata f. sp. avenae TaxID=200324 RepID=A0A2N5T3C2_9BASI|nr:hypothetical protein PCASD_17715 [Puccinia coronata f. sp. avenae]
MHKLIEQQGCLEDTTETSEYKDLSQRFHTACKDINFLKSRSKKITQNQKVNRQLVQNLVSVYQTDLKNGKNLLDKNFESIRSLKSEVANLSQMHVENIQKKNELSELLKTLEGRIGTYVSQMNHQNATVIEEDSPSNKHVTILPEVIAVLIGPEKSGGTNQSIFENDDGNENSFEKTQAAPTTQQEDHQMDESFPVAIEQEVLELPDEHTPVQEFSDDSSESGQQAANQHVNHAANSTQPHGSTLKGSSRTKRIKIGNLARHHTQADTRTDAEKKRQSTQTFLYYLAQEEPSKIPIIPSPTDEELNSLQPLPLVDNILTDVNYTIDEYSILAPNVPKLISPDQVKRIGLAESESTNFRPLQVVSTSKRQSAPFNLFQHCQNRARQYGVFCFAWSDSNTSNARLWNHCIATFRVDTFVTGCEQQCFLETHRNMIQAPTISQAHQILLGVLQHRLTVRKRELSQPGAILRNRKIDRQFRRRKTLCKRRLVACQTVTNLNKYAPLFKTDHLCSDDESNDNGPSTRTQIPMPERSSRATQLVEHIDRVATDLHNRRQTRSRGPPPATRKPPVATSTQVVIDRVRVGLPKDCYNNVWLATLDSSELGGLNMKDKCLMGLEDILEG